MKKDFMQLLYEMVNDIERYPLPICFDPKEEQQEMYLRQLRLEKIAKRFLSILSIREQKVKRSVATEAESRNKS